MQEEIYSAIAIIIIVVGCVWGWWFENGPDNYQRNEKKEGEKSDEEVQIQNSMEQTGNADHCGND